MGKRRAYLGPELGHGESQSTPQRADGGEDPCGPGAVLEEAEEYVGEELVGETLDRGDVRAGEGDLVLEGGELFLKIADGALTLLYDARESLSRLVYLEREGLGTVVEEGELGAGVGDSSICRWLWEVEGRHDSGKKEGREREQWTPEPHVAP